MKNKKKLLVLGGTGFIGYHLIKKCKKIGWDVVSVSKKKPSKEKYISGTTYIFDDLQKKNIFKKLNKKYDYIVNASGYINNNSKKKYLNNHFQITKKVFTHFKGSKIKSFINIGTSAEYGGEGSPQNERTKCTPKSKYGKDKLKCTLFLMKMYRMKKFPSIIFRVYQAYGPLQETNRLIPIVAKACALNKRFNCSDGKQLRDFIFIDDLVNAIIKALKNKKAIGNIFNIGSGKKISIKLIIQFIQKYFNMGVPVFGTIKLRSDESNAIYPNISKAKKILRWNPSNNFKKGLIKTLKFYKRRYKPK